jgi:hypothetical protein
VLAVSFRAFISWISACAIGEALGLAFSGVIASVVGVIFAPASGEPSPWLLRGLMIFAGFFEGSCVGAAQAALLRQRFPELSAAKFTVMTGAGMAVGWAVGSFVAGGSEDFASPNPGTMIVFALAAGVGLGAILGTAQASLLRHHTAAAPRWIVANVVGWALAMVVCYFGTSQMPDAGYGPGGVGILLVTGAAMGAVVGVVTGLSTPRRESRS